MPFIISVEDNNMRFWNWFAALDEAIAAGIAPAALKELADSEVADVWVSDLDAVLAFARSLPDWDLGGSQPHPFTVHVLSL